jgi:hypothetical protein
MSTTVDFLEEKIKMVEQDIANISSDKGREVLTTYLEYLKDELKDAKSDNVS